MADLPTSRSGGYKLSWQEREARERHREWIAGRALTLLSHYWRDDDDEALTSAIAADWCDILEGIPAEYIQRAAIKYQRDEPRRKPTPGAIYQIARSLMPLPSVATPRPEPERPPRVTAEAASEIMRRAGFRPQRFGGEDQ